MAKKRGKQRQGLRAASLEREHETVRLVNNALELATVRGGAPSVPRRHLSLAPQRVCAGRRWFPVEKGCCSAWFG